MREFVYYLDDEPLLVSMAIDNPSGLPSPVKAEYDDGRPFDLGCLNLRQWYALCDAATDEWCDQMLMDDPR